VKNILPQVLVKLIGYFKTQTGDFVSYGDLVYWQKNGFSIIPNHYYSPIPDLASLPPNVFTRESELPGIKMQVEKQVLLLKKLAKYAKELKEFSYISRGIDGQKDPKFYFGNLAYDNLDAGVYYSFIRHVKPKLVLEVGSGWSTKIAAAAALKNKQTKLVAIEPYPQPILKKGFPGLSRLIEKKIEDVPLQSFEKLGKNDILFIDSSHTVKTGGDVNYLFLEVLPRIKKGVWIHIHDIFLPWEYPQKWVKEEFRFWNEQYLVQAFLLFNDHFEIMIANNLLVNKKNQLVRNLFPVLKEVGGGSLWIRKIK
jgi:hypothetical protein